MEKLFLTSNEVADLLNISQQQAYKIIRDMNKQYIKPSSDDIGFILIDDPVQTMDDINISSLIEVLRNDFADKQIILSTHEIDKENYILYKFYKYNKIGQSFNVKEKIYG